MTLVAQDAHVFDGTIRDNLLLADPAAGEPELWDALAAAALLETVAGFSAGLDTPVGPGGEALSGGQRRRLSVAQGVLRRPAVLLLDEPTEGLDSRHGWRSARRRPSRRSRGGARDRPTRPSGARPPVDPDAAGPAISQLQLSNYESKEREHTSVSN